MNIAWLPEPPQSPFSVLAGGADTVWLPYLAEGAERRGGEVRLEGTFDPAALVLGVLLTGRERPRFVAGPTPSEAELCWLLRQCAYLLELRSVEQVVQRATAHAFQRHGRGAAKQALRRAVELLPDCVVCLGDLMANLFLEACAEEGAVEDDLREVAALFERWGRVDTRLHPDEARIWYVGLAALTYIGKVAEREARVAAIEEVLARSKWLRDQLPRLRAAGPGWMGGIALEVGGGS